MTFALIFLLAALIIYFNDIDNPDFENILNVLIIYLGIGLGLLQFDPYFNLYPNTDIQSYYVHSFNQKLIPLINDSTKEVPGFHYLMSVFASISDLDPPSFFQILRWLPFTLSLFMVRNLIRAISQTQNWSDVTYFKLAVSSVIVYAFDWNVSFLLFGDQFKNAFASMFFIASLAFFVEKQKTRYVFAAIAAAFCHKMYILVVPAFLVAIFFSPTLMRLPRWKFWVLVPGVMIVSILAVRFFVRNMFNFFDLRDKLSHSGVVVGLFDSFLSRPGVLLATAVHLAILIVCFHRHDDLRKYRLSIVSVLFTIAGVIAARLGILGIQFVEPNRIYIMMAPFIMLIFGLILKELKNVYISLVLVSYIAINIAFVMSVQSQNPSPPHFIFTLDIFDDFSAAFLPDTASLVSFLWVTISLLFLSNLGRPFFPRIVEFTVLSIAIFSFWTYSWGVALFFLCIFPFFGIQKNLTGALIFKLSQYIILGTSVVLVMNWVGFDFEPSLAIAHMVTLLVISGVDLVYFVLPKQRILNHLNAPFLT